MDLLKRVELFNGHAALLGLLIGVIVEGLIGFEIAHQIGLEGLVNGHNSCRIQYLPFCF